MHGRISSQVMCYNPPLFPPQAGNHAVLELFLKKNPALVFARSQEDGGTPWHYAAQVCVCVRGE